MKVRKGALRPDGTPWAQGPVRVPDWQNMPPKTWGTRKPWKKRVKEWQARPAKERLANRDRRQAFDPSMPTVMSCPTYGQIRWSNGHGEWDPGYGYSKKLCYRMGYWVQENSYGDPRFIGCEESDVEDHLRKVLEGKSVRLTQDFGRARMTLKAFNDALAPKVLDLIIAGAHHPADPFGSA